MAGRVYAITGAFGVLGSAVARLAAEQGASLGLIDYVKTTRPGLTSGPDVFVLAGVDLTEPEAAKAAIDAVAQQYGRLDVLLNIAGGFIWEKVEGGAADTFRHLARINVETAANASRAAIPHLKRAKAGRIVNVGAAGAVKAAAGMAAYAAAKSGVHRLTEALAEEFKADGVTVNAVLPSILDTPTNRADMPKADFTAWVKPEELAAVMLFLASEQATAVTGALIPVTGRV
ncbi:MAG: SDR family NAD(P)-dependent oxidoreductase [Phenylobacterium sp.]|nr:MAG: SDR family NAD(P)-dependent oxidoreductase [Phenylobacterium sp.]